MAQADGEVVTQDRTTSIRTPSTDFRLHLKYGTFDPMLGAPMVATPLLATSPVHRFDRARLEAQMAAKGQTPQDCARAILSGVARNRAVIMAGARSRAAWWFARLAPSATIALTARRIRRLRDEAL